MKFLNIFSLKVVKLSGCLSFDVIVLAFDVLGIDPVFKREIGNKREFSYKLPLPEKVNLGSIFSFRNKCSLLTFDISELLVFLLLNIS